MKPKTITATRKRLKLTQRDFAYLLGVHSIVVSRWERGKLSPDEWHTEMLETFKSALDQGMIAKPQALKPLMQSAGRAYALGVLLVWGAAGR